MLKTTEVLSSIRCWWTCAYPRLIFIKIQQLQIILRATKALAVLNFFQKKICLVSNLKFTLFDVTLFLPDDMTGLKKKFSDLSYIHTEILLLLFTTLEVSVCNWPKFSGDIITKNLKTVKPKRKWKKNKLHHILHYFLLLIGNCYLSINYTYS